MLDIDRSDARVRSAIAHWTPRFVSNGVALTDFEEVTAQIQTWDQWCQSWSARAAVHESAGREALAREKFLSAGGHLQRAGVYYHFAKFLFVNDLRQMRSAHMNAVERRNLALPHLRPPGERLEIPYEGKRLFGILRKPPGIARPPIVIIACGARRGPSHVGRRSKAKRVRRQHTRLTPSVRARPQDCDDAGKVHAPKCTVSDLLQRGPL